MDEDLRKITFKLIVQMSLIFGLISASIHQLWFFYNNIVVDFFQIIHYTNLFGIR
jgi:hypothetical protein